MVTGYDRTRLALQRDRIRASAQAAQALVREVSVSALPIPIGARPVRSPDDVVDTLGLSAVQRTTARDIIREIQSDSRNLLGLARRALDAGLNQYQVSELFRRATELASLSKAEAEPPPGMRPPSGFTPIPRGRKGGFRHPRAGGGYEYWYPGDKTTRNEPHDEDHFDVHEEHEATTPNPAIREAALRLKAKAEAHGLEFDWKPTAKTKVADVNSAEEHLDHAIARADAIDALIDREGLNSEQIDARIGGMTTAQLRELADKPSQPGPGAPEKPSAPEPDAPIGTTDDGIPIHRPGGPSDYVEPPRVDRPDKSPSANEFDEHTGLPTQDTPPASNEELKDLRAQISSLQETIRQTRELLEKRQQDELDELEKRARRIHARPTYGLVHRFLLDVGRFLYLSFGMGVGSMLGGPAGMLVGLWAAEQLRQYREARNIAAYEEPERPLFRRSLVFDLARDQVLWKAEATYTVPAGARGNARKVLAWREKYGDEVRGMTPVGWARARQLASQKTIGLDTVKRMSAFNRHRKNAEIAQEHTDTPWKDAGYVAWLGWGGTTGVDWARRITGALDKADEIEKGASHKYIKRVPTGNPKRPWQYYYRVQDAGGVTNADHFQVGASFRAAGGHYHVVQRTAGRLTIRHDETGERREVTPSELSAMLAHEHSAAITAHRTGLEDRLAKYKPGSYWHTRISQQLKVWDSLPAEQKSHGWKDPKETIESPSFASWFRKSQVVDHAGLPAEQYGERPVVLYHGTAVGGFRSFRKDKDKGHNIFGRGFYFTADREIAEEYSHKDEGDRFSFATGLTRDGQVVRTLPREQVVALLRRSGYDVSDNSTGRWTKPPGIAPGEYAPDANVAYAVIDASDDAGNVDVATLIERFWNPSVSGGHRGPEKNPSPFAGNKFVTRLEQVTGATPVLPEGQVYEVFLSVQNPIDMDAPVSREDFAKFAASTVDKALKEAQREVQHFTDSLAVSEQMVAETSGEDRDYYIRQRDRDREDLGYAKGRLARVSTDGPPQLHGLYLDNFRMSSDATAPRGYDDLLALKKTFRQQTMWDGTPQYKILHLTDPDTLTWGDVHWLATNGHHDTAMQHQFTEWAKSAGYDGIHHTGGWNIGTKPHSVWIAFEPNQIKATNSERFDATTDDIFKSDPKKTPAEPDERVHGSDVNREGSASGPDNGIELSDSVVSALRNKVADHNASSDAKVTLGQLKAVYRRGSGAFSTSHHPNANRHSWSMGRVNSFLRRVKGGDGHSQDDDLIAEKAPPTTVSDKIRLLLREGKPRAQAVAIALDMKRRGELVKSERPSGAGWSTIPGGRKGGFRRPDGEGWEYWYPSGSEAVPHIAHHTERMNEAKAQAASIRAGAQGLPEDSPARTSREKIATSFDKTAASEAARLSAAQDAAERSRSDSPGQAFRGKRTLGVDEGTVWSTVAEGLEAHLSADPRTGAATLAGSDGPEIGTPAKVRVKTVTGVYRDIPVQFVRADQADVTGHIESRTVASVGRDGRLNPDVTVSVPHRVVVKVPSTPLTTPEKLLQSARHVVAHELAHATDNLTRAHRIRRADAGVTDYYNDPAEVVAYRHNMFRDLNTPEVAQAVGAMLDKQSMTKKQAADWREFQRQFGDHGDVSALGVDPGRPSLTLRDVKSLLAAHSPTWKQVDPHLSPENRVRFLKTAAAVLSAHADGTSAPLAKSVDRSGLSR